MKTAFQSGPGFYAADTAKVDKRIPPDVMRIYCARLEAYDVPHKSNEHGKLEFQVLFAQADGNPQIATALLKLGDAIHANRAMLQKEAKL